MITNTEGGLRGLQPPPPIQQEGGQRAVYRAPGNNVPHLLTYRSHLDFLIGPERFHLVCYQVSLNSVSAVLEKLRMPQPIKGRAAILFFRSARKTQTWQETLSSCLQSSFGKCKNEVKNTLDNQRPGQPPFFLIGPKNTLGKGHCVLTSCQVSTYVVQGFREEVGNVSANLRSGRPFCLFGFFFSIGPKNTNLVGDIELLCTVNFRHMQR